MTTPTLHRFALVSLVGTSYKTRLVCEAFNEKSAHLAFQEARKAQGLKSWAIPTGWQIHDRGPVPVTLETLAQEVGNTPLREMDGPTQQTVLALAAIPGKNIKPEPAPGILIHEGNSEGPAGCYKEGQRVRRTGFKTGAIPEGWPKPGTLGTVLGIGPHGVRVQWDGLCIHVYALEWLQAIEPAPVEPRPFQVGDKVKRNGRCAIGMVGKDTAGRVEKVDPLGGVAVAFDGVKAPIIFTQPHHFIELVEAAPEPRTFQPGDRVRRLVGSDSVPVGTVGTVEGVNVHGKWVEVRWPSGDIGQFGPESPYGQWQLTALELVEAAPEPMPAALQEAMAAPVTKDPAAYIQELETELSQVKAHADLTREQLDSLRRERAKAEEILASREITGVTLDARILNLLDKHREHDRINSLAIDQLKQGVVDREADLGVARDMVQEILAIETLRHLAPERLALADGALSEDVQARLRDLLAALAPRV